MSIQLNKLYRLSNAARECGIARSTLESAILRGEIPPHYTACGLPLVKLADVEKFRKAAGTRRTGPKTG